MKQYIENISFSLYRSIKYRNFYDISYNKLAHKSTNSIGSFDYKKQERV